MCLSAEAKRAQRKKDKIENIKNTVACSLSDLNVYRSKLFQCVLFDVQKYLCWS